MKSRKIIAIDFDGTITEDSPFPITGRVRPEAVEVIKKLQEVYICVLWTCRRGEYLTEAIDILRRNGVVFDYVNRSPFPERSSAKIYADVYIDDRSINTEIDWYEIERTLLGDRKVRDIELMQLGIKKAQSTMRENIGGPFGAVIVNEAGEVLSIASNTVLGDHDPTAHAEINAIREACKKIGSHDLTGCTLYATGHPCPMCLSAIIWANIKTVYYGCTPYDADRIGFRDDFIYNFIKKDCDNKKLMKLTQLSRQDCLQLFDEYTKNNKQLY